MIFPDNALNARADYNGNVTGQVLFASTTAPDYTVLYESFNTASATTNANLQFSCGSTILLRVNNFANVSHIERFKFAKCSDDLLVSIAGTTANPTTTVSVVLVPENMASSTPNINLQKDNSITVILLMILVALGLLDIMRRLFMPQRLH